MKFIDWWREFSRGCPLDMTDSEMAKQAWEAGIQEGIGRKREWVGLTYNEIIDTSNEFQVLDKGVSEPWFDLVGYASAIEAKLKEKNT